MIAALKVVVKIFVFAASTLCLALFSYLCSAYLLLLFPINADSPVTPRPAVEAYIINSGVHTDFVFPTRSAYFDWSQYFPHEDLPLLEKLPEFIALGWGDREFYLNTPHWSDLTLGRAMDALWGGNASLLHVTYMHRHWLPEQRYPLALSETQYRALIHYIEATLRLDSGSSLHVPNSGYTASDTFYEARGSYSWRVTCNTWVGSGLAQAGVKVSRWTPFAANVVYHLDPEQKQEE